MEKGFDQRIPFLDVLIDNSDPQPPTARVYRKKTFTGLLTILDLSPCLTNWGLPGP